MGTYAMSVVNLLIDADTHTLLRCFVAKNKTQFSLKIFIVITVFHLRSGVM